ncbi:MAG: tRNA (N6-threonylcarbamoyladenosine(37)-N6)-methyltransferase TrmO [Actinobacteria bacterium]|nr:tRNA (N6-threonylcarbamoyladenosine(37)-N6)-methyltransferase TrmO [Actinomycetota bacterium]
MDNLNLVSVGIVRNELKEATVGYKDGVFRVLQQWGGRPKLKAIVSELIISEQFTECLDGVEEFSHILVVYWANKGDDAGRNLKKLRPAGRDDYPELGIFATRSSVRPNPIGISAVELIERKGNKLEVKGLDAIDGTPVLDIKPPHPYFDMPPDVKLADWMIKLIND